MDIDGVGSITANCKICKHCDTIVKNVSWRDIYRLRDILTKEALLESRIKSQVGKGASNAYWCPIKKKWDTESSGTDYECCEPSQDKVLAILIKERNRYDSKIKHIQEHWDEMVW